MKSDKKRSKPDLPDSESRNRNIDDRSRELERLEIRLAEKERELDKREKNLQKLEERLEKAYELAEIGTWQYDVKTEELTWSLITKRVHGFEGDHQPDVESTINLFKEGENREAFRKVVENALERDQPFDVELQIISGKGDERWVRAIGEPEFQNGECVRFYGISQNISARRQAEEELKWSERRFRSLIQDGADLIAILDAEANYIYVSPTSTRVLGIPPETFVGTNALSYIHEEDSQRVIKILADLKPGDRAMIPPFRFINARGEWRWVETAITNLTEDPAINGLIANSRDVTVKIQGELELEKRQKQLLESLQEKETLLAEIHHRVKNNLAVVSGLMQLQAHEEEHSAISERLFDSIARIQTMAIIHEQLYDAGSFSKLDFSENIRSLVLNIMKTFQSKKQVEVAFDCESVELNINQAIPCSLIVNEVVTNVLKHAFPDRSNGRIEIELKEKERSDGLLLHIRDNGVGLPEDFDYRNSSSLGLSLIDVLSQQLDARKSYTCNADGTTFTLEFERSESRGSSSHLI